MRVTKHVFFGIQNQPWKSQYLYFELTRKGIIFSLFMFYCGYIPGCVTMASFGK